MFILFFFKNSKIKATRKSKHHHVIENKCHIFIFIVGIVGITLSHTNAIPKDTNSLADTEAVETYNQFSLGWWASPIFGTGDYPDVMKWQVGNKSLEQRLSSSRLPAFTDDEIQMNKGIS